MSVQECHQGASSKSGGSIIGGEPALASLASDGRAGVTTPSLHQAFTSQTQVKALGSQSTFHSSSGQVQPQRCLPNQISSSFNIIQPELFDSEESATTCNSASYMHSFSTDLKGKTFSPNVVSHSGVDVTDDLIEKSDGIPKSYPNSAEDGRVCRQESARLSKYLSRNATWSSSASLPRGYRRSEGSTRLSTPITARPFEAKPSGISTLPKQHNVSSHSTIKKKCLCAKLSVCILY